MGEYTDLQECKWNSISAKNEGEASLSCDSELLLTKYSSHSLDKHTKRPNSPKELITYPCAVCRCK